MSRFDCIPFRGSLVVLTMRDARTIVRSLVNPGALLLDLRSGVIARNGVGRRLTPRQQDIIVAVFGHDRTESMHDLVASIWVDDVNGGPDRGTNSLHVHTHKLRPILAALGLTFGHPRHGCLCAAELPVRETPKVRMAAPFVPTPPSRTIGRHYRAQWS